MHVVIAGGSGINTYWLGSLVVNIILIVVMMVGKNVAVLLLLLFGLVEVKSVLVLMAVVLQAAKACGVMECE